MSVYVLIHGAWHGAWCWEKIVPMLTRCGHEAIAVDLPGHGADRTPVSQVTLDAYTDRVCGVLDRLGQPAILVGHSMGGIIISQTAEYRPQKIKALVFVAAMLLQNNESIADIKQTDAQTDAQMGIIVSNDGTCTMVRSDQLKHLFYNRCEDADVERAKWLLTPQSLRIRHAKLRLSNERYGRIPRYYVECLQDHAIPHSLQKRMYSKSPCEKVFTLDTDHSPFFSAPQELASVLLSVK